MKLKRIGALPLIIWTILLMASCSGMTGNDEDIILEIGAGLGALTIPLARRAKKVFAVEKDRQIIPILNTEILVSGLTNISIIEKDILSVDLKAMVEDMGGKIAISTDAHSREQLGYMKYGVFTARRGWLEPEDVINTKPLRKLLRMLG